MSAAATAAGYLYAAGRIGKDRLGLVQWQKRPHRDETVPVAPQDIPEAQRAAREAREKAERVKVFVKRRKAYVVERT